MNKFRGTKSTTKVKERTQEESDVYYRQEQDKMFEILNDIASRLKAVKTNQAGMQIYYFYFGQDLNHKASASEFRGLFMGNGWWRVSVIMTRV